MPQRFPLDPRGRGVYYALACMAVGVAACTAGLRSIAPTGLTPLAPDTARAWAAALAPTGSVRYDLRWRYTTQQGSSAGRAAVRVAPPDTLRFDYRGPFGRSGSALIVGDVVIWAQPEEDARSLLPAAPLFWAALAIPQPPPAGADVYGRRWEHQVAWRYVTGTDELDYIVRRSTSPGELLAELRSADRIVGATTARFETGGAHPREARIVFPGDAALFTFTVEAVDTLATFGPETWSR